MYLPDLQLHQADTLEHAAALMERYGASARLLAGGTDLLVDLKTSRTSAEHLVGIHGIDEMKGISDSADGLTIGALTTLSELNNEPLPPCYAALHDATSVMAAPNIRNAATVGGNLASAVPCADLPPAFIVLDATLDLFSPRGRRQVSLAEFFTGPRDTVLRKNEILTAINVPAPPIGFGAAFERFSLREGNSIAVASVAASLLLDESGIIHGAQISMGAVAPTPIVAETAASLLIGRCLDASACAAVAEAVMEVADPISDIRGSADFRRRLCGVLVGRALRTAALRSGN